VPGAQARFGVDIDIGALRLGQTLTRDVIFTCAVAEDLPFKPSTFDVVIARVSLPYTDVYKSLSEIHRVLRPGGLFWAAFNPYSLPLRTGSYKNWKFWLLYPYLLLNSVCFHILGRTVPFLDGRYKGLYCTSGSLTRALKRAGFGEISMRCQTLLSLTATRLDTTTAVC
jgi:ubiquinone/menaquinone biosynthesis C-methylase UbiE